MISTHNHKAPFAPSFFEQDRYLVTQMCLKDYLSNSILLSFADRSPRDFSHSPIYVFQMHEFFIYSSKNALENSFGPHLTSIAAIGE
jgi:hypothetical protein